MLIPVEIIFIMLTIIPIGVIIWLVFITLRLNREKTDKARVFRTLEEILKTLAIIQNKQEELSALHEKDLHHINLDISKIHEDLTDVKKNLIHLRKPTNNSRHAGSD